MPAEKWDPIAAISRLAIGFQTAPEGTHRRVWSELAPWFRNLVVQAGPKWLPRMGMGLPCHIVALEGVPAPCRNAAVAGCIICHQPTCLAHSFVNAAGETICYGCGARMAALVDDQRNQAERQRTERAAKLRHAREVLGVDAAATWKTIHAAYRRCAKAAHPDRGGTEEKFKEVQEAYNLLKEEHETA